MARRSYLHWLLSTLLLLWVVPAGASKALSSPASTTSATTPGSSGTLSNASPPPVDTAACLSTEGDVRDHQKDDEAFNRCFESVQALLGQAAKLAGGSTDAATQQKREQVGRAHEALTLTQNTDPLPQLSRWLPILTSTLLLIVAGLLAELLLRPSPAITDAVSHQSLLKVIEKLEPKAKAAREQYDKLAGEYVRPARQQQQVLEPPLPYETSLYSPPPDRTLESSEPAVLPFAAPDPGPASDPSQPTGDIVADYKRARAVMGPKAIDWFFQQYGGIPLSCRNLPERRINPAAMLFFDRAPRGDFLAVERSDRTLLFPLRDLTQSRSFCEGVFLFPDEPGTLVLDKPAIVQANDQEWVLQESGVLILA